LRIVDKSGQLRTCPFLIQDPYPYFARYLDGPVHGIFSTDALETGNLDAADQGLERNTGPTMDINTGA
jgi:hypothetical protein